MKNKTLSIPEWHALAQSGTDLPVRILINGISMFPLIRRKRDYVTLLPLKEIPRPGDIVLFVPPGRERYVLHRVWKISDGKILTWGDNCIYPDAWHSPEEIWGKAVLIERGRRKIIPDPEKGLRLAGVWHVIGKKYRWGHYRALGVRRRLRALKEKLPF